MTKKKLYVRAGGERRECGAYERGREEGDEGSESFVGERLDCELSPGGGDKQTSGGCDVRGGGGTPVELVSQPNRIFGMRRCVSCKLKLVRQGA